jgi:signal transduction histidine kinase/ActR/RegA family two-component response regulator
MSAESIHSPEKLLARIEYLEENRRFIQNVLESALSLVDFQENILNSYGPENILEESEKRIRYLIPFEADALYLVNQDTSDFQMAACMPPEMREYMAAEVEDMIEKGFFAWAIRERRGVTITSRDRTRRLVLHVIATHSRIRGMFVGLIDDSRRQIPDTSLTLLSIILLNTANALESLEFYRLLRSQKANLERQVDERTQALAESERQMQQVLKLQAIGTLAGGIAHDFNNILFPIIGYTELTMDDVAEDSPTRRNLEEILKAANRAKDLVQQILTFSRQNGRERKPVRVQGIVKEALRLLRASIPKTIEIACEVDESCNAILGDPTQIHQVIMNLGTNAYQAMQEIGGRLEVHLAQTQIGYEETLKRIGIKMGPHLHLTVADEGVGMEPMVLERIFEPYYTTKEPGKGTGLGLSVIHGIVKNHGGFITVESSPGRGSVFHVYLPTIEDAEIEAAQDLHPVETNGNEHILLVDDEPQIADMGKQLLERMGYRVTARTSSAAALETFAEHPAAFDLVITDMTMPLMTGDRLARRLWEIRPGIPVILCTGYNELITEDKAVAMGIRKFLLKPVDKDELATAVRASLDTCPPLYLVPQPAAATAAFPA